MGILGLPMLVAPFLGPVLSGWLLEYTSWHWIFRINVPIGIIALIIGIKSLPSGRICGTFPAGCIPVPVIGNAKRYLYILDDELLCHDGPGAGTDHDAARYPCDEIGSEKPDQPGHAADGFDSTDRRFFCRYHHVRITFVQHCESYESCAERYSW